MFTGLIQEIGTIRAVRPFASGTRFEVHAPGMAGALATGESVACDGLCLTVERIDRERASFEVAAVRETLRRSSAGRWRPGRTLHLERALAAGARFGGHLVQGHVDAAATVARAGRAGGEFLLTVRIPRDLVRYVVPKGSLAVDGVSLTVAAVEGSLCRLAIIPETLARTRIGSYRPGERVNLEVDLIGKYVESFTRPPGR